MRKRAFMALVLFFCCLMIPQGSWGAAPLCRQVLELPQSLQARIARLVPIPRSSKGSEPFEIYDPGSLLTRDQRFTERLSHDGTYNYTIFQNGDLRFGRRVQLREGQLGLASHRGHLEACLKAAGNCQVIMAGEFLVLNGVVTEVSNRSGTFPNLEAQRPKIAHEWLQRAGIPMDLENVLVSQVAEGRSTQNPDGNYVTAQKDPHAKAFESATFEIELLRNERDRRRILVISRIYRRLAQYFPSQRLGGVDAFAALRTERLINKNMGVAEGSALALQSIPILGQDSIFQYLWNLKLSEIKKFTDRDLDQEQVDTELDKKIQLLINEIDHSYLPEKGADLEWIHQAWQAPAG